MMCMHMVLQIVYSTAANGRAQKRIEKKIQAEATAFNAQVKAFNKQKYTSLAKFFPGDTHV